jgi:hypothetical protein
VQGGGGRTVDQGPARIRRLENGPASALSAGTLDTVTRR